jgi:hypothetical protein
MELVVDTEMLEYFCPENEKDRRRMDSKGPQLSTAAIPASTLARYSGVYDFTDLGGRVSIVEISVADGTLFFDQNGTGRQKLLPFSETAFSLSGWRIDFKTDATGAVTHFLGQAAEGETKGVRRPQR